MRGQRQAIYLQQQSQSSERHESTFGGQSGFCCNELRTSPGLRVWFLEEITRDMQGAPCSVQHSNHPKPIWTMSYNARSPDPGPSRPHRLQCAGTMSPPIVCYAPASRAHPVAAVRRTSEAAQRTARDRTERRGTERTARCMERAASLALFVGMGAGSSVANKDLVPWS